MNSVRYVYTITSEGRPVYVGQTTNLDTRLATHRRNWAAGYPMLGLTVEGPMTRSQASRFERLLIARLNPERNVRGADILRERATGPLPESERRELLSESARGATEEDRLEHPRWYRHEHEDLLYRVYGLPVLNGTNDWRVAHALGVSYDALRRVRKRLDEIKSGRGLAWLEHGIVWGGARTGLSRLDADSRARSNANGSRGLR